MKRRVYIAYTGGTIGMARTAGGYAPEAGYLARQMAAMPELAHPDMPEYTIGEYAPLLDSANTTPSDWLRIARDLADHYDEYDGFVVLHGTDTMAYTASALAFMLHGLAKPVILTGSQIPLCEVRTDGRDNLITSLLIAANYAIPEVCLFFGNRLLRGCRAVKVDAAGLDAFDSPNLAPLGAAGISLAIRWDLVLPMPQDTHVSVQVPGTPVVASLRLFPGISAAFVRNMLQPPLQGLALAAYGVGNGPDADAEFIAVLREAAERGVVIVACTQCLRGTVDLGVYATGSALAHAGVISGYDMTLEAALTKLFALFSAGLSPSAVRHMMQQNLRGELT